MEKNRLFIIGNGFDIAHGMETRYEDFYAFLKAYYPDVPEEARVPGFSIGNHGDQVYNREEVVAYLLSLLCRTDLVWWKDFEATLGELDFDLDFDELPEQYDRDGDRDLWHEAYNNEDLASNLVDCVPVISELFSEWIDTIPISSVKKMPAFGGMIDTARDYFLTFNYTKVLERVYGLQKDRICHIHGVQGETLMVGHGAEKRRESIYIGAEDGLDQIHEALRKDTAGALEAHRDFFEMLSHGLSDIFSYGFSFGGVDEVYIRAICGQTNTTNTIWHLHRHDNEWHDQYKEVIQRCGFRGTFSSFNA